MPATEPPLARIRAAGSAVTGTAAALGMAALLANVALVCADVIGRAVFRAPLVWAGDINQLLLPFALGVMVPVAVMRGNMLAIRFLGQALPRMACIALDALGRLVTLTLLALIAWKLHEYAGELARGTRSTIILRIEIAPLWYGIAAGFALSVPGIFLTPLGTSTSGAD
ncbi:MAG: TRAP transporter small permease [Rhodobacteraceae bacterium]|nr:TRAP transporter small permease [Paracoccaceae bacterium]